MVPKSETTAKVFKNANSDYVNTVSPHDGVTGTQPDFP